MKKVIFLLSLILLNSNFCIAKLNSDIHNFMQNDSSKKIHKITMNLNFGDVRYAFLPLEDYRYTVIFYLNGNAILKRNALCNLSIHDTLPCTYFGKYSTRQFNKIVKFLNKSKFENFIDEYQGTSDRFVTFEIVYGQGKVKNIKDQKYDNPKINQLRYKLSKLKKSIKWEPVNL
jgi:hypothetical protein